MVTAVYDVNSVKIQQTHEEESEILWLWCLLIDMGLPVSSPILLYCDDIQSSVHITNNDVFMNAQNTLRSTAILFASTFL